MYRSLSRGPVEAVCDGNLIVWACCMISPLTPLIHSSLYNYVKVVVKKLYAIQSLGLHLGPPYHDGALSSDHSRSVIALDESARTTKLSASCQNIYRYRLPLCTHLYFVRLLVSTFSMHTKTNEIRLLKLWPINYN